MVVYINQIVSRFQIECICRGAVQGCAYKFLTFSVNLSIVGKSMAIGT